MSIVTNILIKKISELSASIRGLEDVASSNNIDISSDLAYTVLVARRAALTELMQELRSINVNRNDKTF